MTQEAQGTKMGRSSRTAETSVARTERRGKQRTQPLHWPARSPWQGCPRRDTEPAIHMHLCLGFTGGSSKRQVNDMEGLEVALTSGRGGLPV